MMKCITFKTVSTWFSHSCTRCLTELALASLYWNSLPSKKVHGEATSNGTGAPQASLASRDISTPAISSAPSWIPRTLTLDSWWEQCIHVQSNSVIVKSLFLLHSTIQRQPTLSPSVFENQVPVHRAAETVGADFKGSSCTSLYRCASHAVGGSVQISDILFPVSYQIFICADINRKCLR